MKAATVGLTKDTGWQFGVRKTFPIKAERAWEFLTSQEGTAIWLGGVSELEWVKGACFKTAAGVEGEIRVIKPDSHLRLLWKKKDWQHFSLVQIRVLKGIGKCVISIHHEKLTSDLRRQEMKAYWETVMGKLETRISSR